MDSSGDDDSVEIELRDPAETAKRALILAALTYRGFLELDEERAGRDAATEDRFDLLAWIHDEHLIAHVEPLEMQTLQAPLGTLPEAEAQAATWSTEALTPLCWALGLIPEQAPPHEAAEATVLLDPLPVPGSPTAPFIRRSTLRDEAAIARAREIAELWYWRATMQELVTTASESELGEFLTVIAETAAEGAAAELLPPPIGDDFPVGDASYHLAGDHETIAAIAERRLQALNWLCGFGPTWETVPLDD